MAPDPNQTEDQAGAKMAVIGNGTIIFYYIKCSSFITNDQHKLLLIIKLLSERKACVRKQTAHYFTEKLLIYILFTVGEEIRTELPPNPRFFQVGLAQGQLWSDALPVIINGPLTYSS